VKPLFISYSNQDTAIMQRITTWLQRRSFDVRTGENAASVDQAIEDASAVIVLLSPAAKNDEQVAHQIAYAQTHNRLIFPLLLQGDEFSAIPAALSGSQWINLRDERSFDQGLESLRSVLHRIADYMQKLNGPQIHDEMVALADSLPGLSCIALVSVDGIMVDFYRKSGELEEDRISAMSAAMISLGERITSDLAGGLLDTTIILGTKATIFEVMVGDDYVYIAIMPPKQPVDQTLAQIKASAERLLTLLS
jgi:predicted regulator of Ras-like GTPase activity (Roadblock/LC7/MglB family)